MRFEHLTFPPQWKDYWTKYPHGMTILESLIDWATKTNDLIDNVNNWNTYLNDFVATFDENLKQEVTETVQSWIASGYIEVVISAALQTQIDDVERQLNTEVERIDAQLAEIALYATSYGAKPNDPSFDNTVIVQNMLNNLKVNGGGKAIFPSGQDFYFKGTLIIPEGVIIEASGIPIRIYGDSPATRFFHVPDTQADFIKLDTPKRAYHFGFGLKNVNLIGNDFSKIGIDMSLSSYSVMENVNIREFETNLLIDLGMFNFYRNVTSTLYRKYGMRIVKVLGETTTQRFYDCYFGQTYVREGFGRTEFLTAIPIKIESNSVTDCVFENVAIESTEKGVYIGYGNTVRFNDPYTESVSTSQADFVFNLGIVGEGETLPEGAFFKGITSFKGGRLLATANFLPYDTVGTGIFNVDVSEKLIVDGTYYLNARDVLKFTTRTKSISFRDTTSYTILNDLDKIRSSKVMIDNCKVTNDSLLNEKNRQDFISSTSNKRFRVENTYDSTDGELVFENNAGQKMVKYDNNGNVLNHFSGNPLAVAKSQIYGSVVRPDTANVMGAVVVWTETVDSVPQQLCRHTDGKIYKVVARRGSTSARPSNATAIDGEMFYDTTIRKPIWFDASIPTWRDAMGTIV